MLLLYASGAALPSTAGWLLRNASGSAGGACWAGTGDAMGKRLRARTVGVDAAPEFMPKRNYQPIARLREER